MPELPEEPLLDLHPGPPQSEQRRFPRAFVTVAVTMELGSRLVSGTECRNISMGGMFIHTTFDIDIGVHGTVTLTKRCGEKRHSFSAGFIVARIEKKQPRGPGIGVYFTSVAPEDLASLTAIVDFHLSIQVKEKLRIREDTLGALVFKIAENRDELEQAFTIVHDSYVREGYMDPQPSGMRLTLYMALPQSATFVAKDGGKIVMAVSLFPDSQVGLPVEKLYKSEIHSLRSGGRFLAEVGAFATHADYRDNTANAPLHLQKALFLYSQRAMGIDDFVMSINPRHRLFYRHVLLFEQIGEERSYEYVKNTPAIGMHIDLHTAADRYRDMYATETPEKDLHRFMFGPPSARIQLPASPGAVRVWNRDLIRYFFEEKSDLFTTADKKTVNIVKSLYV